MNRKGATDALRDQLGDAAFSDLGLTVLRHVRQWEDSGNPHWIDMAISFLDRNSADLPPVLRGIAADVARRRIAGLEQAAGGPSVERAEKDGLAFALMASLIAQGFTTADAASHAANFLAAAFGRSVTAGTLERKYGEQRTELAVWEEVSRVILENDPEAAESLVAELSKLDAVPTGARR